MVSVIIPFRQDFDLIYEVIDNLNYGQDRSEFEIVVVNDGSKYPNNTFRPLKIDPFKYPNVATINNTVARGVGFSFDRGVEVAEGSIIVLMGSDVFPRRLWLTDVKNAVESMPNTLGCATCIGLSENERDLDKEGVTKRYGANLIMTLTCDDLPMTSNIRRDIPDYTSLFEGQWRKQKDKDAPYKIPCLMGAFYFTSKAYYNRIGGWDTNPDVRRQGHVSWGNLEPYISLKSWMYGGGCTMFPGIEAGHIFTRIDRKDKYAKGKRGLDDRWWNRLFMAHTMLDDSLRDKVLAHPRLELNLGTAKKWIKQNMDSVLQIRNRNSNLSNGLIDESWLDGNKLKIR